MKFKLFLFATLLLAFATESMAQSDSKVLNTISGNASMGIPIVIHVGTVAEFDRLKIDVTRTGGMANALVNVYIDGKRVKSQKRSLDDKVDYLFGSAIHFQDIQNKKIRVEIVSNSAKDNFVFDCKIEGSKSPKMLAKSSE